MGTAHVIVSWLEGIFFYRLQFVDGKLIGSRHIIKVIAIS